MAITGNVAKDLALGGIRGQYSLGTQTGLLAAGTTGEIFQFRWTDSARVAAIRRIIIAAVASTPFGAAPATAPLFQARKATAWSAQGTGGFPNNLSTGEVKRRTLMPPSLVADGDIRFANTAALGAGTKSLESNSFAMMVGCPVSAATGPVLPPTALLDCEPSNLDYPLVLTANEGFVIIVTGNPGTGTMAASMQVEWMELGAGG